MGFNSHRTIRDWQAVKVRDSKGYSDAILRLQGLGVDIDNLLESLIKDSIFFYNYESYKKLGLVPSRSDYDFMAVLVKSYRQWQGDNKGRYVFYSHNGIVGKKLEEDEGFNNDAIGEVIISLTARYDDEDTKKLIEEIYGTSDNPKTIVVTFTNQQGNSYDFVYRWENGDRIIEIGDTFISNTDQALYFLPIDKLRKSPLKNKYDIYSKHLNFLIYAEEEIEIKWYQTKLFRWLFTLIMSFFVSPSLSSVFKTVMFEAMTSQIKDKDINEILGAVISLYQFYSGNYVQGIALGAKTIQAVRINRLSGRYESLIKTNRALNEALEKYYKKAIYYPLDNLNNVFNMFRMYDNMYDIYKIYGEIDE